MRALLQRVDGASVTVDGEQVGEICGPGLCVLVGVTHSDTTETARRLADRIHDLRIFDGEPRADGRVAEVSAADLGLPILVVSQFTLYGRAEKGRRPTWEAAAPGPVAEPLVQALAQRLHERGAEIAAGRFGAHMRVQLTNDGPMTLLLEMD